MLARDCVLVGDTPRSRGCRHPSDGQVQTCPDPAVAAVHSPDFQERVAVAAALAGGSGDCPGRAVVTGRRLSDCPGRAVATGRRLSDCPGRVVVYGATTFDVRERDAVAAALAGSAATVQAGHSLRVDDFRR